MKIAFVQIQNFRKLKSVHIDFAEETTLFVGANNSGKTSAMVALRLFLINSGKFSLSDFTLSHWRKVKEIGEAWEAAEVPPNFEESFKTDWQSILPSLDLWIEAQLEEIHYVSHILPSLGWAGEPLGVRFRYQPQDLERLYKDYLVARSACKKTIETANERKRKDKEGFSLQLWPTNLHEFLTRGGRLNSYFGVNSYILDPKKLVAGEGGKLEPQDLAPEAEPLDGNPLSGLIHINEIDAQRGFSDHGSGFQRSTEAESSPDRVNVGKLSGELRKYYEGHLDPSELPDPDDIEALEGLSKAQDSFNVRLREGFAKALGELEQMGYPGLTDPRLSVLAKIEPVHALRHASAVQYDVIDGDDSAPTARLPEQSSGLGYQNLISIIFRLIGFRDGWMKTGKAGRKLEAGKEKDEKPHPPLHLVLVEEPEAHLHAQVQQVFIRKAYSVLRNHEDLGRKKTFGTQLVVSTHSNHVVYECDFASLRYFRRLPAMEKGATATSRVVNLKGIFGRNRGTEKFETRYIRTTHCDLFFADAVILVEGAAERMFLPHFLRTHFDKPEGGLYQRYISILEIGGSHAHRLKPLIEALALPTLVITDLDSGLKVDLKKAPASAAPIRGKGMVTMNDTLRTWVPGIERLDDLLDLKEELRSVKIDDFSAVRAAYQLPIMVKISGRGSKGAGKAEEALAYTFEDALALENIEIFRSLEGSGLVGEFRDSIGKAKSVGELVAGFKQALKGSDKGRFAIDVIYGIDPSNLKIPAYISSGLNWLEKQLEKRDELSLVRKNVAVDEKVAEVSKGDES